MTPAGISALAFTTAFIPVGFFSTSGFSLIYSNKSNRNSFKPKSIMDIPEPISFEADMKILNEDGTLEPFSCVTKLFTKDVEKQFSASLRMIGLYTPSYVSRSRAKEIIEGGNF